MQNNIQIKSDLKKDKIKFIQAQQNDDMILVFKLFENGVSKNLTGCSVVVNYVNANNTITVITNDLVSIKDNIVTVTCPRNCTRSAGIAKIQLVIISDTKQVSSFSVDLIIIESILMNQEVGKNVANLLEELQKALSKADGDILQLNQLIATAETNIANLITQNTNATSNIANLTAQNNTATSNITNLTNQNKIALTNIANLKEENNKAPTNTANLKIENDKVPANINNLGTQNTNATLNINNLSVQNNTANTNLTMLTTKNEEAKTNVENLDNRNKSAITNIENLTTANIKAQNMVDQIDALNLDEKSNIVEHQKGDVFTTIDKTYYLIKSDTWVDESSGSPTTYYHGQFINKNRNIFHFETDADAIYVKGGSGEKLTARLSAINTNLTGKQPITDNTLTTDNKTVPTAINELDAQIGNVSGMTTTAKILANAINELNAGKESKIVSYKTSNGSSWYRKFSDGRLEQGGWIDIVSSSASGACDTTVTFPTQFVGTKESIRLSANGAPAMYDQNWRGGESHAISYAESLSQGRMLFLNIDTSIKYTVRAWWTAMGWWK